MASRLTGQLADGLLQGALASLVLLSPTRAATAGGIAAASAALLVPFTIVGPFFGGLLDRFQRRQVVLVCGLVRGVLALACALAVVTAPDLVVEVGALAYLSVNRLLLAALSASLPHVVAPGDLLAANAVVPTSGSAAALAGGSLAIGGRALLVGLPGDAADAVALVVAAALAAGAGLLALRLGVAALGPEAASSAAVAGRPVRWRPGTGLVAAVRHVLHRRAPALALTLIGMHRLGYGVMLVSELLVARNRLGLGLGAAGALVAAVLAVSGAGFFVAAALTPAAVRRLGRRRWAASCCALAVLPPLALLADPRAGVLVAAAGVLGFAAQGLKIVVDTVVQSSVGDAVRGRVFVIYDIVFNASLIAATALAALLLPPDGWSPAVLTALAVGWVALAGSVIIVDARRPPTQRD